MDCGPLSVPTNGSSYGDSTVFPDSVLFKCDPGFILNGSSKRTCQPNGTWSGLETVCVGRLETDILHASPHLFVMLLLLLVVVVLFLRKDSLFSIHGVLNLMQLVFVYKEGWPLHRSQTKIFTEAISGKFFFLHIFLPRQVPRFACNSYGPEPFD